MDRDPASYHSHWQARGWTKSRFEEQTSMMAVPAFRILTRLALGKKKKKRKKKRLLTPPGAVNASI